MASHGELDQHEGDGVWRVHPGPHGRQDVRPLGKRGMIVVLETRFMPKVIKLSFPLS